MTTQTSAVEDRFALTDLLTLLYDWIDERRWDAADAVFTEDVVASTPGGEAVGIAAATKLAEQGHAAYDRTDHSPTAVAVELDGDRAVVRCRVTATFVLNDTEPPELRLSGGRGRFEARRTPAGWRFCRIELGLLWAAAPLPQVAA